MENSKSDDSTEEHMPATRMIDGVLETVIYVSDLNAAEQFYGDILGLDLFSKKDGLFLFYKFDQSMLLIFDRERSQESRDVPSHGAHGPAHVCLAVAEDCLKEWENHLQSSGVSIEHRQNWPRGGRSFYFRDPDGNSLELAPPMIWGIGE